MTIEELKTLVVDRKYNGSLIIMQYSDTDFIPMQYMHEIRGQLGVEVEFVDSPAQFVVTSNLFNSDIQDNSLKVLKLETVTIASKNILKAQNAIIICKKINSEFEDELKPHIVKVPKLEPWQIQDFVYSVCEGVKTTKLDLLIELCNSDIYRLNNETKKLSLFAEAERNSVFDDFVSDGIFSDLSSYTIFTFSNAILKKDIKTLTEVYKQLDKIDVEPLGLVTICYNNIRNMIKVQLTANASPETLSMSSRQFWAIKYSCGAYTKDELLSAFSMLTHIDKQLKTGEISTDIMIDYIITHLFINR